MADKLSTQPYKGTRDFYPEDMRLRRWFLGKLREVVEGFGYLEYDGPMLEPFELYAAKTGEEIVNQQLYWLMDRGERKLAVRPEMTPTLARMVAGKIQELPRPVRWYSIPNLWRYERPQRGRLREHWQLNVDVLGGDPLLADAEILRVALALFRGFAAAEFVQIKVNNRRLMDHLFHEKLGLDAEGGRRLAKWIDMKDKIAPEAFLAGLVGKFDPSASPAEKVEGERAKMPPVGLSEAQAKFVLDFFGFDFHRMAAEMPCPGVDELKRLFELLSSSPLASKVVFDPTIMRGMDYYTGTVFECYDISPENRRALFGGGRYDNLLGLFVKQPLPGVGFGLGDVSLQNFLETHKLVPELAGFVDVLIATPNEASLKAAEDVGDKLRTKGLRTVTSLGLDGFGSQLKLAVRHGARFAVLLGDDEVRAGTVTFKDLLKGEQRDRLPPDEAARLMKEALTRE
jgi:histidyl-tRNA synthetase